MTKQQCDHKPIGEVAYRCAAPRQETHPNNRLPLRRDVLLNIQSHKRTPSASSTALGMPGISSMYAHHGCRVPAACSNTQGAVAKHVHVDITVNVLQSSKQSITYSSAAIACAPSAHAGKFLVPSCSWLETVRSG